MTNLNAAPCAISSKPTAAEWPTTEAAIDAIPDLRDAEPDAAVDRLNQIQDRMTPDEITDISTLAGERSSKAMKAVFSEDREPALPPGARLFGAS